MPYIGKTPTVGNFVKLDTITTSATTTFNLTNGGVAFSPQSPNHCIVSLNGVIQSPTTSFTISGSTIVFASALTSADVIDFILVLGDVLNIGTPSDATVGFAKVTSNLITGATAETTIAGGDQILIYDDSATALRKMTRTNFVSGIGGTNTPAFEAYLNSNTGITDNTFVKATFDTERFDTNNTFSSSTFTPLVAGKYFCYAGCRVGNDGANTLTLALFSFYKNGSIIHGTPPIVFNSGSSTINNFGATLSQTIDFNGTSDYLEVYVQCDTSVGSPDLLMGSFFGAYKIIE